MGHIHSGNALQRGPDPKLELKGRRGVARTAEHLAELPLFASSSKRTLRAVAKDASIRDVRHGTTIMTEGAEGNTMLVVLDGTATVSRNGRKVASIGAGAAPSASSRCSRRRRATRRSRPRPTCASRSSRGASS